MYYFKYYKILFKNNGLNCKLNTNYNKNINNIQNKKKSNEPYK